MRQQEVEQLKNVSQQQINAFYAQHIPQSAQSRRRLAVHVVSASHQSEESASDIKQAVQELDALKQKLQPCSLPAVHSVASRNALHEL